MLECTVLPPPTIFIALWLIEQLPYTLIDVGESPSKLQIHHMLYGNHSGIKELIFKAFLIGVMLANKGNDEAINTPMSEAFVQIGASLRCISHHGQFCLALPWCVSATRRHIHISTFPLQQSLTHPLGGQLLIPFWKTASLSAHSVSCP